MVCAKQVPIYKRIVQKLTIILLLFKEIEKKKVESPVSAYPTMLSQRFALFKTDVTVVAVAHERWNLRRDSKCSDLTGKYFIFWNTDH